MANETAYLAGKAAWEIPLIVYGGAIVIVIYAAWPTTPKATATQQHPSTAADQACHSQRAETISQARELLKAGDSLKAYNTVKPCARSTGDAELVSIETSALIAHKLQVARDDKETTSNRLSAITSLNSLDPAAATNLAKTRDQLVAKLDQERIAEQKAIAKAKKKLGVTIGMSPSDAIASSWGRPERVNRTTNIGGIREQWVYPGGQYLYFDNDVLTSISTRR